MARIVSPVWSIIRGSIAGTTYLATRGHQIVARQRTAPVQPNTNPQLLIRSLFAGAASEWNDRTQGQREAWTDYGETVTVNTPTGSHTKNGRGAFMGGIILAQLIKTNYVPTLTVVFTAPLIAGDYNVTNIQSNPTGAGVGLDGFSVSFDNTGGSAVAVLLDVSIGFNAARNFWKGPWSSALQTGDIFANGVSGVLEVPTGAGTAGKRFFFRVRTVTAAVAATPHRLGAVFYGSVVAAVGV